MPGISSSSLYLLEGVRPPGSSEIATEIFRGTCARASGWFTSALARKLQVLSKVVDQTHAEGVHVAASGRNAHIPEGVGIVPHQAGIGTEIPVQADGGGPLDTCRRNGRSSR